jgi:quinol monooxygenase YgiN
MMIIVAGYATVPPDERDRYVDAFRGLVRAARAAPGCLDVAMTADSVEAGRVNIFELWATQDELDAWRASAPVPEVDTEFEIGEIKEYLVASSRDPFGA